MMFNMVHSWLHAGMVTKVSESNLGRWFVVIVFPYTHDVAWALEYASKGGP